MAKIFTADSDYYVVASNIDNAVTLYHQERGHYPETITVYKEDGFVFEESTIVEISTGVLPELAETDGAVVSPSLPSYIKKGDAITLQATTSPNYTTFVNWTVDGVEVAVTNPFTYVATDKDAIVVANFSA